MRKTKTQKAITLIALIITIMVLLILAVVAITSITNDSIIEYANNAVIGYENKQDNEKLKLDEYEDFIINYRPGGSSNPEVSGYKVTVSITAGQYGTVMFSTDNGNTWNTVEYTLSGQSETKVICENATQICFKVNANERKEESSGGEYIYYISNYSFMGEVYSSTSPSTRIYEKDTKNVPITEDVTLSISFDAEFMPGWT